MALNSLLDFFPTTWPTRVQLEDAMHLSIVCAEAAGRYWDEFRCHPSPDNGVAEAAAEKYQGLMAVVAAFRRDVRESTLRDLTKVRAQNHDDRLSKRDPSAHRDGLQVACNLLRVTRLVLEVTVDPEHDELLALLKSHWSQLRDYILLQDSHVHEDWGEYLRKQIEGEHQRAQNWLLRLQQPLQPSAQHTDPPAAKRGRRRGNAERDAWLVTQHAAGRPLAEIHAELARISTETGWECPAEAKSLHDAIRREKGRLEKTAKPA
jgi:hypothetical protein